ncbi:MAG: hypothetical protein ACRCSP_04540 [Rhodoglobus sp.]
MTWQGWTVVPVWALAVLGALAVGSVSPREEYLTWLSVVLAAVVITTVVLQIATRRPEGFVVRAIASIGVSVVLLAAATGVVALLG